MKKALLATLIGASVSVGAWADTFDCSYAESIYNFIGFGTGVKEYDVAIFLPGETFQGCKIKSVSGPINASAGLAGYANCSVWLSSDLVSKDGANVPDIASVSVDPAVGGDLGNGYKYGIIGAELPEDYTITADGVFVGYSFKTTRSNNSTKYPVAVGMGDVEGSIFMFPHYSNSRWADYSGQGLTLPISVVLDGVPADSAFPNFVPEYIYMVAGESKTLPLSVTYNSQDEPVSSFDFEITVGDESYTSHFDLEEEAPAGLLKTVAADVLFPVQNDVFTKGASVKVSKINGKEVASKASDFTLRVFEKAADVPVRRAVMEEMTCTKCGYCIRGYAALEYIKANYPEFICISYHNNQQGMDPMTVGNAPVNYSGNPKAALNRSIIEIDPYYGTQSYNMEVPIIGDILALNAQVTPWNISVGYSWEDEDNLTANVKVCNVFGMENANCKIGYVLVSDGLSGTTSQWAQTNYYSSESPTFVPELNNFCRGGIYGKSTVTGLVFNDVAISLDGYKGVDGSMPSSLNADEVVEHSQTWDLAKIKSELVPDKTKLRIVAFVLNANGEILNAAKVDVTKDFSGVRNVADFDADAPVEYFNLSGVKVANPSNGIFIRRQGSKAEKVVIK